jgi:membrane protein implicated in regulation of membrane protease activity
MGILVLIILVAAAISGTLWEVLEIAAGVAIGLFLFVALVAAAGYWVIRRRMGRWGPGAPRY